jgi:hypothetical protein
MKVILPEALFSSEAIALQAFLLEGLFYACMGDRHALLPEFDRATSSLYRSWREQLSLSKQDLVDSVLRSSAQAEARETIDCVIVADPVASDWSASPPRVGPDEIVNVLRAPLTILVEHELNDGAFLRAVGFGIERDTFLTALERDHIRLEHAGGSSMKALIEERKRHSRRAYRLWAIFDSDALVPEEPSSDARDKIDACRGSSIRHHMLARRAIENYLPYEDLDRLIPHTPKNVPSRQTVGAFKRLRPDQRAHFNMKSGFNGDAVRLGPGGADAHQKPAVDAHFADVRAKDRQALAAGFGKDIAQLFVPAPDRGHLGLSEAARRRDGQADEMVPLFRRIVQSL